MNALAPCKPTTTPPHPPLGPHTMFIAPNKKAQETKDWLSAPSNAVVLRSIPSRTASVIAQAFIACDRACDRWTHGPLASLNKSNAAAAGGNTGGLVKLDANFYIRTTRTKHRHNFWSSPRQASKGSVFPTSYASPLPTFSFARAMSSSASTSLRPQSHDRRDHDDDAPPFFGASSASTSPLRSSVHRREVRTGRSQASPSLSSFPPTTPDQSSTLFVLTSQRVFSCMVFVSSISPVPGAPFSSHLPTPLPLSIPTCTQHNRETPVPPPPPPLPPPSTTNGATATIHPSSPLPPPPPDSSTSIQFHHHHHHHLYMPPSPLLPLPPPRTPHHMTPPASNPSSCPKKRNCTTSTTSEFTPSSPFSKTAIVP